MKKIYLLTFSLFALTQLNAQTYTLTQTNSEPVVGDTYLSKGVDTTGSISVPLNLTGMGINWNFTGLYDTLSVDTNKYVSPAADANSSNYPGVTLVQHIGTNASYYKSSSNKYELLGVDLSVSGQSANLNYNTDPATIAQYNITFGYSNSDAVAGDISAMGQSGTFSGNITSNADGVGTLNLNNTTLSNCIRIKSIQHLDISLLGGFVTGTLDQTIYNYYNSTSKFPLFTITYPHINIPAFSIDQTPTQISMLNNIFISVKENKLNDIIFKAYPNPASNNVSLHFVLAQPESYTIEISNTLGQVVKTLALSNLQPGMYNETIDTNDLGAGIYTVKVSGKKAFGTEKLIIQK